MNPKHMVNDNTQHPGSYKCVFAFYGIKRDIEKRFTFKRRVNQRCVTAAHLYQKATKHTVSVTSLHISLVYSSTFIKV